MEEAVRVSPRVTESELASDVAHGERNVRLTRYAGAFVAQGIRGDDLIEALQDINATRLSPPLDLKEVEHHNVKIDQCVECNGVWLDPGEIEQLEHAHETGVTRFFSSMFGRRQG